MSIELSHCGSVPLNGGHVAGFSAGYDDQLYVLVCMGDKDENWIERRDACDWRVICVGTKGPTFEYTVASQRRNFNLVQPLPNGILLATSRCAYSSPDRQNACVFNDQGDLSHSILLGDGIQDMQTTASGEVWVSYFDEGVFGNLGWEKPIGASGLLRFDAESGEIRYKFEPLDGLDFIWDCYALNVPTTNEAWACYYTDFPLVRIQNDQIVQHWTCPVAGASRFALWRDTVLMDGGYNSEVWRVLTLRQNHTMDDSARLTLSVENRHIASPLNTVARADCLWCLNATEVYCLRLRDRLRHLGA